MQGNCEKAVLPLALRSSWGSLGMGMKRSGLSHPAWAGRERAASPGWGQRFERGGGGSLLTSHPRGRRHPMQGQREGPPSPPRLTPHPGCAREGPHTPCYSVPPVTARRGAPRGSPRSPHSGGMSVPTPSPARTSAASTLHRRHTITRSLPPPTPSPSPQPCLREVTGKKLGWKPSW